jgi:hypothetical protein
MGGAALDVRSRLQVAGAFIKPGIRGAAVPTGVDSALAARLHDWPNGVATAS